jgi:ubiquinone biosynthesis monooxygenase Coq7
MNKFSKIDKIILHFDSGLRTLWGQPLGTHRPDPAQLLEEEVELTSTDQQLSARLMRVNHAGEVAAQALYQGQALTARRLDIRDKLQQSALEENDHLLWCQNRLQELNSHVSWLNPIWYPGSLLIGAVAGLAGDKWSLGFLAETERQVVKHLENHLQRLPASDHKSRAILKQMQIDEAHHAATAIKAGAVALPRPVRWLMKQTAKIMTKTAFWV